MDNRESPLKSYMEEIGLEAERHRVSPHRARKLREKHGLSPEDLQRLDLITGEILAKSGPLLRRNELDEALAQLREARNLDPLNGEVQLRLAEVFFLRWKRDRRRIDEKETLAHLETARSLAAAEKNHPKVKELKRLYRRRKSYLNKNSPYRDRRVVPLLVFFLLLLIATLLWVNREDWVPQIQDWLTRLTVSPKEQDDSAETDSEGRGEPEGQTELPMEFSPPDRNSPLEYHPRKTEIDRGRESFSLTVEGFFTHPSRQVDKMEAELVWKDGDGREIFRESQPVVTDTSPPFRPGDPLPFRAHTFQRRSAPDIESLSLEVFQMQTAQPREYPEEEAVSFYGPGEGDVSLYQRRKQRVSGVDGQYEFYTLRLENVRGAPLESFPLTAGRRDSGGNSLHETTLDPLESDGSTLYPGDSRVFRFPAVIPPEIASGTGERESQVFFSTQDE